MRETDNRSGCQGRSGPVVPFLRRPFIRRAALGLPIVLLVGLILSPLWPYSDLPKKSDIIIEFAGDEARSREARQLVGEGFSDYLFIPASFTLYRADHGGRGLTNILFRDIEPRADLSRPHPEDKTGMPDFKKIRSQYHFPGFYEDTHAEALLAKKAMDACGFRKAIFVSSPYHLRRIKIISESVFGPSYDIRMVPVRFEKKEASLLSHQDIQYIFAEFPKMIWFLCYDLWGSLVGEGQ